ncbi:ABC transporter ATP-binding protein [Hungatella hathewayi]
MIKIENLVKRYGKLVALDHLNLEIEEGEIYGLLGPNGSGKTTTIKAMLDIVKRDAGDVEILGMDIREREQEVKEEIGVVFGESQFHDFLSAVQISGIMKRVYKNWDEELFSSYLSRFALPEKKKVKEYSRGMAMKLAIAAALSHHPKLLILDEATSGLDPVARDEILDLFFGFIEDGEHSVLIASHITSDLDKVADYVTMIHNGSILFSEEKDQLLEDMGILRCGEEELAGLTDVHVVGVRKNPYGVEALIRGREYVKRRYPELVTDRTNIEEIMLYSVRRDRK